MLILKSHETDTTKRAWVTFYNREAEEYLSWIDGLQPSDRVFPSADSVYNAFNTTGYISNSHITPQMLREWFCEEMGILGVGDRYIDAFCGRVSKSMLSRSLLTTKRLTCEFFTDVFSPANLLVTNLPQNVIVLNKKDRLLSILQVETNVN